MRNKKMREGRRIRKGRATRCGGEIFSRSGFCWKCRTRTLADALREGESVICQNAIPILTVPGSGGVITFPRPVTIRG